MKKTSIAGEFARRAIQFHPNKDPMTINLWGLFSWGSVSYLIKKGDVIPNAGFRKENRTIWCKPSLEFYNKEIKPIINKLKKLKGEDLEIELHNLFNN